MQLVHGRNSVLRKSSQVIDGHGKVRERLLVEHVTADIGNGLIKSLGCLVDALKKTAGRAGNLLEIKGGLGVGWFLITKDIQEIFAGQNRHVSIAQEAG